ncbi:uncharacterized protein CANTADRAFT_33942, partial [Suhomyces tanzawaensis NRRL Y-17324]
MSSHPNQGEVFAGGATTSQHVDAQDDTHFENTTFKLKRTRSLGLLDEFIQPDKDAQPDSSKASHSLDAANDSSHPLDVPDDDEDDSILDSNAISFKSPELLPHDDTDIANEPSRHVDYFSHQWDVSDISRSWRYVISKRKDVANSARLENASWRTWAQRRCNLKTISPEVVNWSKDSDVTWLYGPILKDNHSLSVTNINGEDEDEKCKPEAITTATSAVAGDISIPNKNASRSGPKPILKRRTVEDMIISQSNLLKLELATNKMYQKQREKQIQQLKQWKQAEEKRRQKQDTKTPEYDDFEAISAKLNSQYKSLSGAQASSQSNSLVNLQNLIKKNSSNNLAQKAPENDTSNTTDETIQLVPNEAVEEGAEIATHEPALPEVAKGDRHIHFNDQVQQCIAVDTFSDDEYDDEYYDDSYDDDESSGMNQGYYYDNEGSDEEENGYTYGDHRRPGYYHSDDDAHEGDADDDEEDDDEDDEGGFFLNVKSPSTHPAGVNIPFSSNNNANLSQREPENTEDTDSLSTANSKMYKTIQLLPPTTLNYGSDEESTEENPYTSSLSHNVDNNSRRGYDYYYDYNTVYTVDPNHAIYGNKKEVPEVCDVPENITLGSNFDYESIEHDEYRSPTEGMPIINPSIIHSNNINNQPGQAYEDKHKPKVSPFQLSDSEESDSDSDGETLSIGARRSSQSLAQLVFNKEGLTPNEPENHFPTNLNHPQPVSAPVSSINPNHSTTSITKQPHSSNSLSESFFGGNGLTKQKASSNSLSDQFFGGAGLTKASSISLSDQFFNANQNSHAFSPSPESQKYSKAQKKASPLPPHTTSTNAFLGNTTPPLADNLGSKSKNTFMFDTDSESEDEFLEHTPVHTSSNSNTADNYVRSYASLSQVAGKNGIRNITPEGSPVELPVSSPNQEGKSKIVDLAKGFANHLLGGWKN